MGELSMKDHVLRARSFVAVAGAILLLAVACGGSDDTASGSGDGATVTTNVNLVREPPTAPVSGGTLRFGLGAETSSGWDPVSSQWGGSGILVSRAIFDRLTAIDATGRAQPYLAESLTPNADFTSWDIKLRPGIVFHNGEALDAEALKINLDRLPKSILLADFKDLTSVEVVDPLTVRMTISVPWSTLPYSLSSQAGAIMAPEQAAAAVPSEHPIGTGPFVFQTWERDRSLTVTRNPNYWRTDEAGVQLPYLDGVEFTILADPSARTATMESGGIDAFESFDPAAIKHFTELAQEGKFQIYTNEFDEAAVQFVGLNTVTAPFDDILARRLVTASLNPAGTSTDVYLSIFPKANGLFSESSPYFSPAPVPGYDPALATRLSQEYQDKYGKPLAFSLNLPSTTEYRAVGEAAQTQLAQFGIELEINQMPEPDLIRAALTGDFEATGLVTFGDPWTDQVFISGKTNGPVGQIALNFTRLTDPQIDEALAQIRTIDNEAAQIEQWQKIQARLAENANMVFIVRNRSAVGFTNDVFGFEAQLPSGDDVKKLTQPYLTFVWKTPES